MPVRKGAVMAFYTCLCLTSVSKMKIIIWHKAIGSPLETDDL